MANPPLPEMATERGQGIDVPPIPLDIKSWSVADDHAIYRLADGSKVRVPITIYRIWESGFIAAAKELGKDVHKVVS